MARRVALAAVALGAASCVGAMSGQSPGGSEDAGDGGISRADAAEGPADAGPEVLGPSAGCGREGARTGLQSRTMMIRGRERTYLRFIPASYELNTPLALVITLHGTANLASFWRDVYDLEEQADGEAIFVYPNALPNANGETKYQAFDRNSDDFAFVDALIEEVEDDHCIDRDRVFVTGFSLGGTFAANLGCWRGEAFRAIAPVGAGGGPSVTPLSDCVGEVADWQAAGDEDAQHRPGSMFILDRYISANGCADTRTETTPSGCYAYDSCRPETPTTWCNYPGGHEWPRMATVGVWSFFARFE